MPYFTRLVFFITLFAAYFTAYRQNGIRYVFYANVSAAATSGNDERVCRLHFSVIV